MKKSTFWITTGVLSGICILLIAFCTMQFINSFKLISPYAYNEVVEERDSFKQENEDLKSKVEGYDSILAENEELKNQISQNKKYILTDNEEWLNQAKYFLQIPETDRLKFLEDSGVMMNSAPSSEASTEVVTPAVAPTTSQKNALQAANSYLSYTAFSYDGLISQLEYEQYSHEDAVYAADNCGADWNAQAVKMARQYLDYTSFSRNGLIDQLEYEGFTPEQAAYGADNCGENW